MLTDFFNLQHSRVKSLAKGLPSVRISPRIKKEKKGQCKRIQIIIMIITTKTTILTTTIAMIIMITVITMIIIIMRIIIIMKNGNYNNNSNNTSKNICYNNCISITAIFDLNVLKGV